MANIGSNSKPAYVYDAGTDTWIPIGPGEHTHDYVEKSTLTTTGDLVYASAANTPARLGIGSTGNVLTVSGGAPAWASPAGGMTLLDSGTLSGASVTTATLATTYNNLLVYLVDFLPETDAATMRIRFNGDSGSNYRSTTTVSMTFEGFTDTSGQVSSNCDNEVTQNLSEISIPNYANTVTWKFAFCNDIVVNPSSTTNFNAGNRKVFWGNTSAITSITFLYSSGNHTSGNYYVYGVK
jgi:hypothetical protein